MTSSLVTASLWFTHWKMWVLLPWLLSEPGSSASAQPDSSTWSSSTFASCCRWIKRLRFFMLASTMRRVSSNCCFCVSQTLSCSDGENSLVLSISKLYVLRQTCARFQTINDNWNWLRTVCFLKLNWKKRTMNVGTLTCCFKLLNFWNKKVDGGKNSFVFVMIQIVIWKRNAYSQLMNRIKQQWIFNAKQEPTHARDSTQLYIFNSIRG